MPSVAKIENSDPLTEVQAIRLITAVRGSELYSRFRDLYPEASTLFSPYVDLDSNTSRLLAAIVEALDALTDTTVAIKGGRDGVDYSAQRDRELLLQQALDAVVDRPAGAASTGQAWTTTSTSILGDF